MASHIESMNIVYFACKTTSEAQKISKSIISEKLGFCVNIIPRCYSIYRWKGQMEETEEAVVIVKTLPHLVNKLVKKIKKIHSYDMPEIISWKIDKGSSEILNWVTNELKA